MPGVLATLTAIAELGSHAADIGSFISSLWGGSEAEKETEKAQAYQEKWAERIYADEQKQQRLQNTIAKENLAMSKAAQYFNQRQVLRDEARTDNDRWRQNLQNNANKYADLLNQARAQRTATASALRNR